MAHPTLTELIDAVDELDAADLEHVLHHVLTRRADRTAPALDASEAELLLQINKPLPHSVQKPYIALCSKRANESLTAEEHAVLLHLTAEVEAFEAERITHLAQLAQLRGTTLSALMDELGLAHG